jgi:tetratricopeptide (TPR) repeat protein
MPSRRTVDAAVIATLEWIEDALGGDAVIVADRAAREDAFARLAVNGLLNLTTAELRQHCNWSGYDGIFVVQQLLGAFDTMWHSSIPFYSLAVVDAAVAIAKRCDRVTPALLFHAWKERANALRQLGHFDEAFRSLERAEAVADDTKCPPLHHALLANCRASVYIDMRSLDVWDLLHEARETFLAYGDVEHAKWTRTVEGSVWYGLRRYEAAIRIYESNRIEALNNGDQPLEVMELGNIAGACLELGDVTAARCYFDQARNLSAALGMVVMRARMTAGLGQVAIREKGPDGRAVLERACSELDRLGLAGDLALARLEMAEEILKTDPTADVSSLAYEARARAVSLGMDHVATRATQLLDRVGREGARTALLM